MKSSFITQSETAKVQHCLEAVEGESLLETEKILPLHFYLEGSKVYLRYTSRTE